MNKQQFINLSLDDKLDIIQTINSYDNSLGYLNYYKNDQWFYDEFYKDNPYQLACDIQHSSNYNFNDDYIFIDVYGNLNTLTSDRLEDIINMYIDEILTEVGKYNINIIN